MKRTSVFLRRKKKNKNWQDRNPRLYDNVRRGEKKEKKRGFCRFLFWFLLTAFVAVSAYFLLLSSQLEIVNVRVSGNQQIRSSEITAAAITAIEGTRYKYFSKSNFFLMKKDDVRRALKSGFTRLDVLNIEKIFPNTISISVKERQPELVWCSGGACYFVDKEGLVFSGIDETDPNLNRANFLTIVDDNAKPVEIGQSKIQENFVEYLKEIDAMLTSDLGWKLADNYHTPALASGEVFARIAQDGADGWSLKLDSNISPQDTKKIIQSVMDKDINGDQINSLDYLDLSVKGKVYYKFR